MRVEKIYFDLDGVLADFDRGVEELCEINKEEFSDDEMWEEIRQIDHFYAKLKPISGMQFVLSDLFRDYGLPCEILSAIPKPSRGVPTAKDDKLAWCDKYIPLGVRVNICYRADKKKYCKGKNYILIDDFEENVNEWKKAGGYGIVYRGNPRQTMQEILKYIDKLKKM